MELRDSLEIRKLSPKYRAELVKILQREDDWKTLMANIPELLKNNNFECDIERENLARYNSEHIRIVEVESNSYHRFPADVLLEEWGSSGRVRPTLGHLFYLVQKLEMLRAAEYLASLLNKNPPKRPTKGPSAAVELNTQELRIIEGVEVSSALSDMRYPSNFHSNSNLNVPDISNLMRLSEDEIKSASSVSNSSDSNNFIPNFDLINETDGEESNAIIRNKEYTELRSLCLEGTIADPFPGYRRDKSESAPGKSLSLNTPLRHFGYSDLKLATNDFDKTPVNSNGRFLGSGGYGSVYLALGLKDEPTVAVKKITLDGQMLTLQDHILNSFKTEVENLYKFKHENLVGLLGYSCDGPSICLVYEYIPGGNLKNQLLEVGEQIDWETRIKIALGISKAVCYLHVANPKQPFIHRDIKTANILLDEQKNPKLCDFGTARLSKHTTTHTINVIGTGPYMSPEGTRGDVSVKLDTFSFGVVLLELLTGWPPSDYERTSYDLLTYVREILKDNNENVLEILDKKAGNWTLNNTNFGLELYSICKECVQDLKTNRPFMMNVKDRLQILVDLIKNKPIIIPYFKYDSLKLDLSESILIDELNLEYISKTLFSSLVIIKKISVDGHSSQCYDFHLNSFKEEVEKLSKIKHENILSLLGYSCEYPNYCLIFEYFDGDNLQNKLEKDSSKISCLERLEIALMISKSITYFHNAFPDKPMVHRDLKSNNILLDERNFLKVKLGRIFKHSSTQTLTVSKADPYLSPEGVRGDISVKLDSFSFGIILLELLTALPPFDSERNGFDLLTHFEDQLVETEDPCNLFDDKIVSWISNDIHIGKELYEISNLCFKDKLRRPNMTELKGMLEELKDKVTPKEEFRPALSFLMNSS